MTAKTKRRRRLDRVTLGSQLREALRSDGRRASAIGQAADVPASVLSRFLSGERDVQLGTADRLAAVLGLRLSGTRRSPKGPGHEAPAAPHPEG